MAKKPKSPKPKVSKKLSAGKKGKKEGVKNKNIRIAASAAIAALAVVIAVALFYPSLSSYSFEKGLDEIKRIDSSYNTSIYTEGLDPANRYIVNNSLYFPFDWNKTLVDLNNVGPMVSDLNKLKKRIGAMGKTSDAEALLLLIEARKKMLESERLFQLGEAIGPVGSTADGFSCRDMPYILNASDFLNRSTITGQEATGILDDILNNYPQTRPFLTEGNRLKFFDSPFWPVKKAANNDKGVVLHFCSGKGAS